MTKRTDRIMRTRIRLERAHRLASFNRKISTLLAAILLLCLASGPNGTTANPRGQFAPAVGQNLANQTSNAISMLLKQSQASACDGEQLEIKCDDDYVIEIITAELTILHREHHKHASSNNNRKQQQDDNKVTTTSTTTSAAQPPEATSSRATSAGTRAQEEGSSSPGNHQSGPPPSGGPVAVASAGPTQSTTQESQQRQLESSASNIICPRLDYAGGASRGSVPTTRDSSGSSQTGNGASQMVDAGSMTTAPLEGVCNETEALEASGERKAKFLMLVRKHCSLHKSCSIDLRLGEASNWQPRTTSGEEASNLARTASAVSVGGSNSESNRLSPSSLVAGGQSSIGQFLSEKCPMNRKLVELAYKCRPRVFRSKATCRGAQVTLNCSEPGKVLAIGSAHYGPWPEDKKNNDRCLLEEQSQQRQQNWPTTTTTASSNKPISISTPKSNCTNNPMLALSVLARECLFKHQCQFQVQPGLFSTCPLVDSGGSQYQNNNQQQQQLPDYLKVAYLCVNEEQLITTNSSFLQRQLALTLKDYQSPSLGTTGDGKQDRQQASSSFVSQNVSSSSLRGSVSPQQQFITPPANFGTGLLTPNPEPSNSNQSLRSYVPSITTTTENRAQQPYQPDELSLLPAPNDIGKLIEAYPSLGGKPPSEWTAGERVQFVLRRYEKFLIAFAVITISVSTLLALVARFACGPRSTRQSNASSSTSSKSSSSSSSVQKSFGSSSSSSSSTNCTNQTACTATMSSQQQQHLGVSIGGFNSLAMGHQHHLLAAHQNNYSKPPPTNQMMHQLATGPPQPANNHNHHHQHKLQPTNSCSESCFSLDDCNCPQQQQQQTGGGSGKHLTFQQHHMDTPLNNNSPALQSNQTTPPIEVSSLGNCHQEHQQQQQHHNGQLQQQAAGWTTSTLTAGGARPKLWSFYVNEQHSNSMRLGSSSSYGGAIQQQQQQQQQQHMANFNNAATLRAQRTFSGQPQPALARNFECLQRQDGNQVMLGAPPSLEPHQNDYLLTMASVGQQQQLGGGHPTPSVGESGWCPHSGLGQITDNAGEQRLHLVTLNPAELMESGGGHHHHNPQSLTLYAPTEPGS